MRKTDEPLMNGALTRDDDSSLPFKGRVRVGMGFFDETKKYS